MSTLAGLSLLACSGEAPQPDPGPVDPAPSPTDPVAIVAPAAIDPAPSPDVPLVRLLTVSSDRPTGAEVELVGAGERRSIAFPEVATDHELPLLGLVAGEDYEARVTLTAEDGSEASSEPIPFHVDEVELLLPELELLVGGAGAEPRYTLLGIEADDTDHKRILVVDLSGRVVWVARLDRSPKSVTLGPDGLMGGVFDGTLGRLDPVGAWVSSLTLPGESFHHEALQQADGSFFSLLKVPRPVSGYPLDEDHLTRTGDVVINDDRVVHVAPDGTLLVDWSLAERLDERRIGFGSTDANRSGLLDWGHGNAATYVPADGSIVVSLRNQDAVVKLDHATGEVRWILANHDGWGPGHQPLLLEPVGTPFAWPYHQHAPTVSGDRVLMFDNGNFHRTTPYAQQPEEELYSRLVEFEVDEQAGTVRQTWAFTTGDPELYSAALGNADYLPGGHVLGTWSFLTREDGVVNLEIGRGRRSIRVIEVDPVTSQRVWDLRLFGLEDDVPGGWQCDRATRVASLYGSRATETWLQD